jgi:hypothetical protein
MAKIPLPERGQPIDVSYMYQIANAVNSLAEQVTTTGFNYTTVDTLSAGKQNIRTSEARIIAGNVQVTSNTDQAAGSTKPFTYSYNGNFLYTPVVTATVVNSSTTGATPATESATVVITSIDANGLAGLVRFNTRGRASTSVNLIIVGIPN